MAPSLLSAAFAGGALFAAQALATEQTYQEIENWGPGNFFDNFEYFESKVSSLPNRYDIDPTGGFVNYRNQSDAESMKMVKYDEDGLPYIGVDHTETYQEDDNFGRSSVRLESTKSFGKSLFIFDIAHLPAKVDGAWPAIWTYGDWVDSYDNWPKHGDIDIYENWNKFDYNRQTLHTSEGCTIHGNADQMTNTWDSYSCNYLESGSPFGTQQWTYQGCSSHEGDNTFGNEDGGVYVVEYTDDHIKMWTFRQGSVPSDIIDGKPDPSSWSTPGFSTLGGDGSCDIQKLYGDQKIVFNLDFCGTAGDVNSYWPLTTTWHDHQISCPNYVANNPTDFEEYYFLINSVKIYQKQDVTSTSSSSSSSSTSTSSLSATSSSVTVSTTGSSSITTSSAASSSTTNSGSATSSSATNSGSATSSSATITGTVTRSASSSSASLTTSATNGDEEYCDPEEDVTSSYPTLSLTSTSAGYPTSNASTSAASYTTSTVYSTKIYTITSCAATVTDCPAKIGQVTTEVIAVTTTVCPVTETETAKSTKPTVTSIPAGYTTSTQYITKVYTITSCAPTVTNCPVGSVTSEVQTAVTVTPITKVAVTTTSSSDSKSVVSSGSPDKPISSSSSIILGTGYYGKTNSTSVAGTGSSYIIATTAVVVAIPSKAASSSTYATTLVTSSASVPTPSTSIVSSSAAGSMKVTVFGMLATVGAVAWAAVFM